VRGKSTWLALVPCALLWSEPLSAQAADAASEPPTGAAVDDEVIVHGRRVSDFRAELHAAMIHVYDVFNELNSDDAFDVHCQVEDSTGTRMREQTCRPQFKDDISNAAAKAWVNGIRDACGGQLTQDCIFSDAANQGKSAALSEEAVEPLMQKRFALEMARVVAEHPEMQQAILDYQAVERAYDEALGGRRGRACDREDPPPRCTR
jgi:hypothetical protein